MRYIRLLLFLFIVVTIFSATANAQNGYVVRPGEHQAAYQSNSTQVTFWQLPDQAKFVYASSMVASFVLLLKFLPFVQGKIDDILKNENRSNILRFIYRNPGSTIAQVSQVQKIDRATVRYHLYKLESEGKIVIRKIGRYSRVFRNSGAFSNGEQKIIAYLQNNNSRAILILVMERPGITNHELTESLGIEKSAVSWHMDKLLSEGLVSYEQDGRSKRYYISDSAIPMLQKHTRSCAS